ncbi:MAG: creatininase family protein [Promethearchaeota archaeon]
MTWKDIEAYITEKGEKSAMIIPIGCLEEHGPHLPVSTDSLLTEDFANAIAEDPGIDLMFGPLVDFGVAVMTRGFPGTISIKFDTLRSLLIDVLGSVVSWGIKIIFLWTWHGGSSHLIALREAALNILETSNDVEIYIYRGVKMFDDDEFKRELDNILESKTEHACELETSLMLYLHPDLVDTTKLTREYPKFPRYKVIDAGKPFMNSGIVGDSGLATREKGEKLFNLFLGKLKENIKNVLINRNS